MTYSVSGGHLLHEQVTAEEKLGGFQKCACEDYTELIFCTKSWHKPYEEVIYYASEAKDARFKKDRQPKEDKVKREREEKLAKDGSLTFIEVDVEKMITTVFDKFGYKQKKNWFPNAILLTKLYDVVRNEKLPVTQALQPNSMKPMMHPTTNEFVPYSETVLLRGAAGESMLCNARLCRGQRLADKN